MPDDDKKRALQREIESILQELQTFRDDIRVRIHLGGMDLKDKWNELEPRFDAIERQGERATQKVRDP
jgi:hypothetical protein